MFKVEPQRANDSNIMENELSSNNKNSLTPKQFNTCINHMELNSSSENFNANGTERNGTELKTNLINYIKTETSHSRLRWPNQPKLYDKYWEAWINIIKTKYCKVRYFHLKTKFILGYWIKSHHSTYHIY